MSEATGAGQVLVLTDGSPAATGAVRIAGRIARALDQPLAILGVSAGAAEEPRVAAAVREAQTLVRPFVPTVVAVQTTGELLATANGRVAETPTSLVVLGASRLDRELPTRLWALIRTLKPPVLVAPEGREELKSFLFCSGGARYIEEGAALSGRIAAGLPARVTVFHVSPRVPLIYGGQLAREEINAQDFLNSNSRLAHNIRRQIEIFREAGCEASFRIAAGDIAAEVRREIARGGHDLLIVGSSPGRRAIQTYVLGNETREIVTLAGRPFLVLRPRALGFWGELWHILTEAPEKGRKS